MGGSMISTSPFSAFLVSVFLFFLLLHLPLLSAGPHHDSDCSALPHFCGNLNISFPFFNDTKFHWHGRGGVELIRCINGSTSVLIYTGVENDESTYEVQSINYTTNTILARDRKSTRDWLSDNDKCNALFNNYTMPPIFRYLSAHVISPNLTLRVCKRYDVLGEDCTVEAIPDAADVPAPGPSSHPSTYDCKLVHLPVDVPPSTFHGLVDPVSKLFTAGFRVQWNLPKICHQCEKNGTVCSRFHDQQDNLSCVPKNGEWNHGNEDQAWKKKQRKTIRIGILGGAAAGILFSSLFFFIIYKYRVGHKLGRVRSSYLKMDLEKGSTHLGVPIFSYAELEEATNNFSSVNELGDGGFGTVYHGKLRDGRVVAIKRLYHNNKKHIQSFMNEIEILTHLRHQNLVTLYGCTSYRSRELLLVYEFIPNGTVADHLHGDRRQVGSLPWPVRMSIAMETACALSYLHVSDIIHRDVKTSNILLDNHFHVKVADFGLCRLFPIDATHVSTAPQGTPGYVDPEYHRSYQLTNKSDVYSFGVVLIELISSKPAVDITRHRDEINLANMAMNKIQNGDLQELVDPYLGFESDCTTRRMVTLVAELAFRCLQHERELRPSMEEVVEIFVDNWG
ncbi:LEAF RUST 10 DISEASE-RESISTANCE LOCUS RECEPTOR-LIKE PROTEIN KINASE-like 1.1 [Macadamia integrifolia]|uniref:LEAF RUST 10 DISEASE-RESISTANCE LOCUS RECEPTOR-LIKE PROTEIN KINASE-like 1.1 n=1 Tax=Macadamia integrifolia TaxID=60698 RepID=UPI001C4FD987|nr:LEAF RUST 10 DISEASE-RESISTANCE LOCUS RECEPTOR-LIKE PROTEIN KINASE-like 1.1 [Macadamia integrifolia]